MAEKNLDGSGLNVVWVRAAQLVKRFTGAVNLTKGDLQTQVDTKVEGKAISSSSAITTEGQYALDAREKNASVDGTLANQISNLNSNLDNHLNKNCQTNFYTPSNTNYETLLDLLINEIFAKSNQSFCIFGAENFSDLPQANWGFTIIAFYTNGAVHVYAYQFLSNNIIYMRGCDFNGNWIDDWKQLSFV